MGVMWFIVAVVLTMGLGLIGSTIRVHGNFVCGSAGRVASFGVAVHGGEPHTVPQKLDDICREQAMPRAVIGAGLLLTGLTLAVTCVFMRSRASRPARP